MTNSTLWPTPAMSAMTQMAQTQFETVRKLSEVQLSTSQKLMHQQLDLTHAMLASATRGMESMAQASGYTDWISGESELARSMGEESLKSIRQGLEVLDEARHSMTEILDHHMKGVAEAAKPMGAWTR
jgi:hypothetical protein